MIQWVNARGLVLRIPTRWGSGAGIPVGRESFIDSIHVYTQGRRRHEMLKALCGSLERFATVEDVKKHANTLPKPLSTQEYQRIRVWGPVLKEDGHQCVGVTIFTVRPCLWLEVAPVVSWPGGVEGRHDLVLLL